LPMGKGEKREGRMARQKSGICLRAENAVRAVLKIFNGTSVLGGKGQKGFTPNGGWGKKKRGNRS